jgi:hypothetical protein
MRTPHRSTDPSQPHPQPSWTDGAEPRPAPDPKGRASPAQRPRHTHTRTLPLMLSVSLAAAALPMPPRMPLPGQKLQHNISSFTVNAYECLQLPDWPSERVHCEKNDDGTWNWIVEHFDDAFCTKPNPKSPVIHHVASGCVLFPKLNHSYNDKCHDDGTVTVSAFGAPGCMEPMPAVPSNFDFKGRMHV